MKATTITNIEEQLKQVVFGPISSPMIVNPHDIIYSATDETKEKDMKDPKNFRLTTNMVPGGDKTNIMDILGIKMFLKFQTFIMLRSFFMNAFPSYKMDSRDKPNGFNEDPERAN